MADAELPVQVAKRKARSGMASDPGRTERPGAHCWLPSRASCPARCRGPERAGSTGHRHLRPAGRTQRLRI